MIREKAVVCEFIDNSIRHYQYMQHANSVISTKPQIDCTQPPLVPRIELYKSRKLKEIQEFYQWDNQASKMVQEMNDSKKIRSSRSYSALPIFKKRPLSAQKVPIYPNEHPKTLNSSRNHQLLNNDSPSEKHDDTVFTTTFAGLKYPTSTRNEDLTSARSIHNQNSVRQSNLNSIRYDQSSRSRINTQSNYSTRNPKTKPSIYAPQSRKTSKTNSTYSPAYPKVNPYMRANPYLRTTQRKNNQVNLNIQKQNYYIYKPSQNQPRSNRYVVNTQSNSNIQNPSPNRAQPRPQTKPRVQFTPSPAKSPPQTKTRVQNNPSPSRLNKDQSDNYSRLTIKQSLQKQPSPSPAPNRFAKYPIVRNQSSAYKSKPKRRTKIEN